MTVSETARTGEPAPMSLAAGLVRSLRPKQWAKNTLVVAAPVAAGVIDEGDVVLHTIIAFVCFCAAASATYLVNDATDVEADRRHPTKRNRPIAAGVVPPTLAYALAAVLLVGALVGGFALEVDFGWVLVAYLALTTAYTYWLKDQPVLDIVAVAAGFVLRAIGGAAAVGVPISEWFFIVTSFGALFMVTGKRHAEALDLADEATAIRPALDAYTPGYLHYLRSVFSGGVLIAYCIWAFNSAEVNPDGAVLFQISVVPFAVAILRYALLLEQGKGAEPESLIMSDRIVVASGVVWAIIYGCAVYTS